MLEELLNKLIEKGWKPFGYKADVLDTHYFRGYDKIVFIHEVGGHDCCVRELVSKESGLWQYVCENGMYKSVGFKYSYFCNTSKINYICNSYQYRLIETSLKNEDELEQFLLDNIKIDE